MGMRICAAASAIVLLLFLVAFDERLEAIETDVPEFLPLPKPARRLFERPGVELDEVCAADLAPGEQPGVLEHLHVLRCAGEAHADRTRQLADRLFAKREAGEHPAPRRIR